MKESLVEKLSGFVDQYSRILSGEFYRTDNSVQTSIINSGIVAAFLGKIGCTDASWILCEMNRLNNGDYSEVDQRKLLHEVMINFMVGVIMIKGFPKA